MKLSYPVHDIDNRLLLPAGTELSEDVLEDLISSNRAAPFETLSLLEHGSVREDIFKFLSEPPYQLIFPQKEDLDKLLIQMEKVQFVLPFLRSLDYFKKYDFTTYSHLLNVFALSTLLAGDLIRDYQERISLPLLLVALVEVEAPLEGDALAGRDYQVARARRS